MKGGGRGHRPSEGVSVVLVRLRLWCRLLRMLGAVAAIALLHALAAVHPAIAVPVGTTTGHGGMAVMLAGLTVLHLAVLHLAVLLMVLMRLRSRCRRRCRLRGG
jgi:hypothetical protein